MMPDIREVTLSPAQATHYAALKQTLRDTQLELEKLQNFLALSVVSVEEVPRTTVTETATGLAVSVMDA